MPFDPLPSHHHHQHPPPALEARVEPSEHGWYVTLWVAGEQVEDWRWSAHRSTRWGAQRKARQLLRAWMARVERPRFSRRRDARHGFTVASHTDEPEERLWPWSPNEGDSRPRPW